MRKHYKMLFAISFLMVLYIAGCTNLKGNRSADRSDENPAAATSTSENGNGSADNYPNRSIELVVPFAAGGGVDLAARAVADYLSKEWGESIVVVNKPRRRHCRSFSVN